MASGEQAGSGPARPHCLVNDIPRTRRKSPGAGSRAGHRPGPAGAPAPRSHRSVQPLSSPPLTACRTCGRPPGSSPRVTGTSRTARRPAKIRWVRGVLESRQNRQASAICDLLARADQLVKAAGIIGKPRIPVWRTASAWCTRPVSSMEQIRRPGSGHRRSHAARGDALMSHPIAGPSAGPTAGIGCDGQKGSRARAASLACLPGPCRGNEPGVRRRAWARHSGGRSDQIQGSRGQGQRHVHR